MVKRYVVIGLLAGWVGGVQGAQPESSKTVKNSKGVFELSQATSVTTLDPQKKLFVDSYSAAFEKLSEMEKMNQKCHIPTTSEDLEGDFEAAFTVEDVNAGDQILVNAFHKGTCALAGFLFMRRVLGQDSKPVPGDFKLDFVAIEPHLFNSGLGSQLINFVFENTEGLRRLISPARPTNSNFTDCLKNLSFEENKEKAKAMVDAILKSGAPEYQKELARKDMTAYVYDAQKVHAQALKDHYGPFAGTVLGVVSECTIS